MSSHQRRLQELEGLFLGPLLGEGEDRSVYALGDIGSWCSIVGRDGIHVDTNRARHVIKVETSQQTFQNVAEWLLWDWLGGTAMGKWLAPCISISPCGTYLVQRHVEPIRKAERPKRLPAFLCDLKRENFGMMDGRVVCCDYGLCIAAIRSANKRMKPVQWACG